MSPLVMAALSIGMSVAAQFCLKTGMSDASLKLVLAQPLSLATVWAVLTQPYVLGGFVLYGLGAVVWLSVLAQWEVSKAYPLVGLGFALTVLVGFLLGEQMTMLRVAGVALICSGVWMVAKS